MMWFGCVGASSKNASVWLCKHSDEAYSLVSRFGVSFEWVLATASNLPNEQHVKLFLGQLNAVVTPTSTLSRDTFVLTGGS